MRECRQFLFVIRCKVLVCEQSNSWHDSMLIYITAYGRSFWSFWWTLCAVVHRCSTPNHFAVATSQLILRWMCDSTRTGCAQRITPIYKWREHAIIEWSRRVIRIANLAFLKPDFEILAFFNSLGVFDFQKQPDKIWLFLAFFSVGKAWLWLHVVWAACLLQTSSDESLRP